ncbi:MAG: hypothetical protein F8N36_14305 [Desulfovibrio sp.]|uniref:hypothetical protein n=1 Tax=Desulfovibrio sp. TaxID=885 RepID=UPI00135D36EE|nr:hypothetical protein [Desulfovibrio sp.]MTJ94010.1 hypothetical protein [Desulfovibrio sp.]
MAISTNHKEAVFVIDGPFGTTKAGFQTVYKTAAQLAKKLGVREPPRTEIGNVVQYEDYRRLLRMADRRGLADTWFEPDTPVAVQRVLERVRNSKAKIRIYFGDPTTGKVWIEGTDVIGFVGRSTGTLKTPQLLDSLDPRRRTDIPTLNIVRIQDVKTGSDLYRHPGFHLPRLSTVSSDIGGYEATVMADGKLVERFQSQEKAEAFVAFQKGERMDF